MRTLVLVLAALALANTAYAQKFGGPPQNPDWPCAQRLVETLEPGSYWNGPPIPAHTAWRDDADIFTLANDIVDRDTPEADALAKLNAYADALPQDKRATAFPFLFGALVDQTNDQRSILIARIEQLGRRQRAMGDTIAALSTQIDADPATSPTHADLIGKRDFDMRAFSETQHTMRYACEAPANMERRLGLFARALEAKIASR